MLVFTQTLYCSVLPDRRTLGTPYCTRDAIFRQYHLLCFPCCLDLLSNLFLFSLNLAVCLSVFNLYIGITYKGPLAVAARAAAARLLGLWVRIPPVGMSVSCECCVLSVRRADHSSRGALPSVVCLRVTVKPRHWGGTGPPWGGRWYYLYSANCEACAIYSPLSPIISSPCQVNVRTSNIRMDYHFIFRIRYTFRYDRTKSNFYLGYSLWLCGPVWDSISVLVKERNPS